MSLISEDDIEKLRPRVRLCIAHHVGFACPDADDMVQESLTRFLLAVREDKISSPESMGPYLNGICRNVIFEYHRRILRDGPMPEILPDPPERRISGAEQFEIREAITHGLAQLSPRDRQILHAFYIEEKPKVEVLVLYGLSDEQFRVILCRAKERFRLSYNAHVKHRAAGSH